MVQANELGIGNCISLNGKQVIVKDIPYLIDDNKEGYLINEVWADEYEPIPLTPEILEMCGYLKSAKTGNFINKRSREDAMFDSMLIKADNNNFSFCINSNPYDGYDVPIKYLHQLQNFYFALTGEELTVNIL